MDRTLHPLHVRTHHVRVNDRLDEYVRSRAAQKLGKHARQIAHVTVRFDDLNGPKRGPDIVCRLHVVMFRLPAVIVEDRGTGPREAFDLAVERAWLAVERAFERAYERREPR